MTYGVNLVVVGFMKSKSKNTDSRHKKVYHLRNWPEYDRALVNRGAITMWIGEDAIERWQYKGPTQRGAQFAYSNEAMECMLVVKEVYHLTNRTVEGFMCSIFSILKIGLDVPDHSTLSRRGRTVHVRLPKRSKGPLHLVLDSSGLKVYGEGEWKVRQHGWSKRRTWRKVHLATDSETHEIQAVVTSEAGMHDSEAVELMLEDVDQPIDSAAGDGSYDRRLVYQAIQSHSPGAQIVIPPRKDAHIWLHGNRQAPPLPRDQNLRYIRKHGRQAWKRDSNYHRRSLAETTFYRFKTIFGDHLSARLLAMQEVQVSVRCRALNVMTHLGMPESYMVA
jgi:transposase